MFGLFKKNPTKKLEQQHQKIMEEAMAFQRKGDLRTYSDKISEAEKIMDEIVKLKNKG